MSDTKMVKAMRFRNISRNVTLKTLNRKGQNR